MLKRNLLIIGLLCFSFAVKAQTKQPFYYELISNDSKTVNFVFGFYPSTFTYTESKDVTPYTSFKCAVINNSTSELDWKDYKINILLKSGKLIRSYSTVAESGDYACNYTVKASTTHYQYFCFHTKFEVEDIDKVYLSMGDDEIFSLIYDENK